MDQKSMLCKLKDFFFSREYNKKVTCIVVILNGPSMPALTQVHNI